jgi:hypothetical protein
MQLRWTAACTALLEYDGQEMLLLTSRVALAVCHGNPSVCAQTSFGMYISHMEKCTSLRTDKQLIISYYIF